MRKRRYRSTFGPSPAPPRFKESTTRETGERRSPARGTIKRGVFRAFPQTRRAGASSRVSVDVVKGGSSELFRMNFSRENLGGVSERRSLSFGGIVGAEEDAVVLVIC